MPDGLIERIQRATGVPDLVGLLADRLAPTDLQSLLLSVFARLAERTPPKRLLQQYEANRFVAPSVVSPRLLTQVDAAAWELLPPHYVPLDLSPLCPLGTSSVVATVSQNKIVSTIRNTEVVADSTNVLALECAARRRQQLRNGHLDAAVHLAASHRQMRAQPFSGPKSWAHFRLITLCAAGRDQGTLRFESRQLVEHVAFYVALIGRAARFAHPMSQLRVAFTDLSDGRLQSALEALLLQPLAARCPELTVGWDPTRTSGRGYYDAVCFKLYAIDGSGTELEVGDGGCAPWTATLLSNAKERLVISGLGVERLCTDS